ncbi:MAG: DUF6929 family protein [Burkholderiaceae bacterium]
MQRELTVARSPGAGRPRHLSAASGLVRVNNYLYVIADDEHHLGIFCSDDHQRAGRLIRLRRGTLPSVKTAHKRRKPDFEALLRLPPLTTYPHGALFAMGSGSKPNRRSAVLD